jgi:hypothetical protein
MEIVYLSNKGKQFNLKNKMKSGQIIFYFMLLLGSSYLQLLQLQRGSEETDR